MCGRNDGGIFFSVVSVTSLETKDCRVNFFRRDLAESTHAKPKFDIFTYATVFSIESAFIISLERTKSLIYQTVRFEADRAVKLAYNQARRLFATHQSSPAVR